jgi:isopenicillin-N N-acyltransferase-like protein
VSAVAAGPLPVLRVAGDRRRVGRELGELTAATVRRAVAECPAEQIERARAFWDVTARELPEVADEYAGIAEGAGVDLAALFAVSVEQFWQQPPAHGAGRGRCTDMVAGPAATADGGLWVAHTNDLDSSTTGVVAVERRVEGRPAVFTIGVGPWISVGFNEAGLAVTGNELAPNDLRVGIPPLVHMHRIVAVPSLAEAIDESLHPHRSSSYNYVFCHRDGGAANVEGSATDAEVTGLDAGGVLAHTNHYACERMRAYEGDPEYAERSAVRLESARGWLREPGVTPERLRAALSDHTGAPDSICRHPGAGSTTATAFWCIADVSHGEILFGAGQPCTSTEQRHVFD